MATQRISGDRNHYVEEVGGVNMSFIGNALGSITGANAQAHAQQQAASTQAAATDRATQLQQEMYEKTRKDLQPYTQAGVSGVNSLSGLLGLNGQASQQALQQDPSYQFRLQTGLDGVQSGAAAQGNLLSGATQKALNNYAQSTASQEYGNTFNRLLGISQLGENAAAQTGNSGNSVAQSVANNTMQGANAIAAGQIAQGNTHANNMQNLLGLGTSIAGLFI